MLKYRKGKIKIAISLIILSFAIAANAQNVRQILNKADSLSNVRNYTEAIALLHNNENLFERANLLSFMYGSLSYLYLFTKDFNLSEQAAHQALTADSTQTWVKTNLAHSLLFQRRVTEAEKIYNELANTIYRADDT